MSLYQVQKLLFNLHNNLELRERYHSSPNEIVRDYKLDQPELQALGDQNIASLYTMGVNPWLLFQFAHMIGVQTGDYLKQIRGVQADG